MPVTPTPALPIRGFSLLEMVGTIVVIGLLISVAVPRLKTSSSQIVYEAARQVAYDLEAVRERALSTASETQVVFDPTTTSYTGFLDTNRDGVILQNAAEATALQLFKYRALGPKVTFGLGSASAMAGFPGSPPITFAGTTITFDTRGLPSPIGTKGAVYVSATDDPSAVAAITMTGSAYVRIWRWQRGAWR
jgi:type II secretory pathway pseudopilin PulG